MKRKIDYQNVIGKLTNDYRLNKNKNKYRCLENIINQTNIINNLSDSNITIQIDQIDKLVKNKSF